MSEPAKLAVTNGQLPGVSGANNVSAEIEATISGDGDSFEFIYDGPDLAGGSMNTKSLSEVLAGLSKAFSVVAHDNDFGDRYELRVRDVESGSFHILFEALAYVKANPVSSAVLATMATTSWTVLKDSASGAYRVVTDIIKVVDAKLKLKGTAPNKVAAVLSDSGVVLELPDGSVTLTKEQFELLLSRRIDKPLAQIVSPLAPDQVTSFEVRRAKESLVRVELNQRDYFDYQETTETVVREGTELIGRLNSLTKTSQRGTFYTADGVHVAYRYVGGDQTLLLRGFSTRNLVKVTGRIRYDAEGVPTSIDVQDIEPVQSSLLSEE